MGGLCVWEPVLRSNREPEGWYGASNCIRGHICQFISLLVDFQTKIANFLDPLEVGAISREYDGANLSRCQCDENIVGEAR